MLLTQSTVPVLVGSWQATSLNLYSAVEAQKLKLFSKHDLATQVQLEPIQLMIWSCYSHRGLVVDHP